MTAYPITEFVSDLNAIDSRYYLADKMSALDEIDKKIGRSYPKKEFLNDVFSHKPLSKIKQKLSLIQTQKSVVFLAKKRLTGEYAYRPQDLVRWDYYQIDSQSECIRSLFRSEYEKDVDRLVRHVSEIEGYPSLPSVLLGAVVGAYAFSAFIPTLLTGAAAGALYKLYKIYEDLGDAPEKPTSPSLKKPIPGLRFRVRRIPT